MASSSNPNGNSNTITTNQSIQTTFSFISQIKLDRSNYMLWRNQVLASIRGNRLEGYINGEKVASNQFITTGGYAGVAGSSTQQNENPEYTVWRSQDQTLLSWLLSSVIEGILSLVHSCNTSYDVWKTLEKKFGSKSEARVLQLRYEMSVLRKDSLNIEDYCLKMKQIADKLACVGSPVSDKDLLQQILNGLGQGYLDLASFITASKLDYDDAYALLLTHETRLEQSMNEKQMFNANFANFAPNNSEYGMMNAFYAQARGNARRGGYNGGFHSGNQVGRNNFHTGRGLSINSHPRGFPSGTGNFGNSLGRGQMIGNKKHMQFMRGQYSGDSGMPNSDGNYEQTVVCQICFKSGHTATKCWHRFEENYEPQYMKKGRNQRSAYMAYYDAPTENSWSAAYSGMPQMYNPSFTSYMSDSVNLPGARAGAGAAYVANFEGPADEGWYLDNGATHHLTNNMENMHVRDEFNGNEKLIIGNGKGMSITPIGSTTFSIQGSKSQAARKCITLKDILFVPSITKNLISVSKLTTDNNLSVEFFGSICFVNDSLKGKVLLQGIAEKDLSNNSNESLSQAYTSGDNLSSAVDSTQVHVLDQQPSNTNNVSDQQPILPAPTILPSIPDTTNNQSPDEIIQNQHILTSPSLNHHPMVTRGKACIFKPKLYTAVLLHKEPETVQEALNNERWFQAMKVEYNALISNGTWTLVPRTENHKLVGNKWVFRIKTNTDESVEKYKARLVAKGFQQIEGVNYFKTFSPVVKSATVKVILSLAVMNQWQIRQVDVNNAFLNGDLTEEVYMRQLEGFVDPQRPDFVCKLYKALYGLKQAPRAWFDKLKGSDCVELKEFIKLFSSAFALKDLRRLSYFLVVKITDCKRSIVGGQQYLVLTRPEIAYSVHKLSQSIVGGQQYLVLTRPEIAYSVHKLSQYVSSPTLQHLMACKRVLRYLKETQEYSLKFVRECDMKLTAFTDANWGSDLDDRRSVGAYCVYLGDNLISWSSKKQSVVTKSSVESEYRALAAAVSEITWLKSLFLEIGLCYDEKPIIWCDNVSAAELAHNPVFHSRTKHIEIDLHFIRDKVLAGDLKILYVPSAEQIADILTKPLNSSQFNYLRLKLNVQLCPLSLRGVVKKAHCVELKRERKPTVKILQQCHVSAESADSVKEC
ncbi:retrovirus-related pol polyprotein from transposon RE2 [Citrus sinensis]|uniref:Retrovirus-related pol polyprotein from transposon RE2 n=1 Tax=Citrus sinensis TaxID=2711 RepID=A0ACB8JIM5_CITSI|nr:retrovirus-related pol polyprotein from transposon RE2 [Citrus sinensis]